MKTPLNTLSKAIALALTVTAPGYAGTALADTPVSGKLSTLNIAGLSPAFDPNITAYTIAQPADCFAPVTATVEDPSNPNLKIFIAGNTASSGTASTAYLCDGKTSFDISIYDVWNEVGHYTITSTGAGTPEPAPASPVSGKLSALDIAGLSPAFDPDITSYTIPQPANCFAPVTATVAAPSNPNLKLHIASNPSTSGVASTAYLCDGKTTFDITIYDVWNVAGHYTISSTGVTPTPAPTPSTGPSPTPDPSTSPSTTPAPGYVSDLSAPVPNSPAPKAVDCSPSATAATLEVGTGLPYPTLSDVDWNNLQPGDVVRVHWRAEPYADKILLSASGTVAEPIKLCGVPGGPNVGDKLLPTITGENASTRPDLAFQNDNPRSYNAEGVFVLEPLGLITIQHKDWGVKPSNIIIEGLHLTGTNQFTTFTGANGNTAHHDGFAACIRLQKGDNITIRGNEIENCGHAVFANSRDYESQTSRNLLIESNYVHGNGAVDVPGAATHSESVHAMYIQTIGMTAQFNYFGPNRDGSIGGMFKDRSVGSVVRYNWFSQGARILDFVEPQSYDTSFMPAAWDAYVAAYSAADMPPRSEVVKAYKQFQKTYVYGNFISNNLNIGQGAYAPIHFGGDEGGDNNLRVRQGKLYFFNNTVSTHADSKPFQRTTIFDMGYGSLLTTPTTKIEAFNNIFLLQSKDANSPRPDYYLARHDFENINLGKNWISGDWQPHGFDAAEITGLAGMGVIDGISNLIGDITSPVDSTSLIPGAGNAALLDAGQALPAELDGLTLDYEFQPNHANPLLSIAVPRANANDLGASAVAP
ncbi:MAG: hypothetical protein NTV43_11115 [Methylococcales bacterium]|nr:hypothetical protein [Methylococcales bacterium]